MSYIAEPPTAEDRLLWSKLVPVKAGIKNSAYRPIRPESAKNPGAPGEHDLKKQSQFHWSQNERKVF
jgi:hypothetical protein